MKKNMHTFVVLAYKESQYLEECIKSVLNQKYHSKVVIATSTPNKFIDKLAKKYKLDIIENNDHKSIGGDFDFAIKCAKTPLVTIAHQDDIYEKEYLTKILKYYNKYKDSIILFTDYYEIRNNKKIFSNINLKIKRLLLLPLNIKKISNVKFIKRSSINLGNSICCPSVTFNKMLINQNVFYDTFKCNVDWDAWEKLSKLKGRFIYINDKLMRHRIHNESTTTKIIENNIRTIEDYEMFKKFWPNFIAKILAKIYKKSEKNNKI